VTETRNVFPRWVRLKQKAKKLPGSEAASMGIESAAPQAEADAAEHQPFDPASLPSIDTIAADTEIVAFLQSGVPAELTRAALRRAWTSDPAIRDFVGIAENQWDFNDPNAIPGFGSLGTLRGQVACLSPVSPNLTKTSDLLAEEMSDLLAEGMGSDACDSNFGQSEQFASVQLARRGHGELQSTPVSSRDICEAHAGEENEDAVGQYDVSCDGRCHGSALPK
jgi:Protein of unknown function (DUF3306)